MWKIELVLAAWTQKASARQWCLRQLAVPQAWGQSYAILPIFSPGLKIVPWGHHASPLCDFLCSPLSLLFFLFVILGTELRASHTFRQIPAHQAAPQSAPHFYNSMWVVFSSSSAGAVAPAHYSTPQTVESKNTGLASLSWLEFGHHTCFRAIGHYCLGFSFCQDFIHLS